MNRSTFPTALVLLVAPAALARPEVGPGDFSGSETRINFDALAGGSSLTTGDPVNTQFAAQGIVFSNSTRPMQANAFPSNTLTGHTLPNTVFVDQGGGGTPGVLPLNITLSVPVNRIGMYVCGSFSVNYTMRVYGASGLLETLTKPGIPQASGAAAYVGLQRPELITRVEVACAGGTAFPYNFFIDDVQFEAVGGSCYANCDNSTGTPKLTGNDFTCFINAYATGQSYANCDGSTGNPALTANDFACFINAYALGCS